MIIIFIRAIILFAVLLLVFRLMGKRQIGEMEPFELVITLVISELACIPMADRSIPITFGIVAILTMFVIHQFILILSHSDKLQGIINGKPVMVVNGGNIDVQALKSLNMHVNDLLQAMRAAEYFSLEEIIYGRRCPCRLFWRASGTMRTSTATVSTSGSCNNCLPPNTPS